MVWANASAIMVQWRAQILACPSVIAIGVTSSNIHYPQLDLGGGDALPAVKLVDPAHSRTRHAEGAVGLAQLSLSAHFYVGLTTAVDAGFLETFARDVVQELWEQYYGFAWRDISTALASDPTPGQRAAGEEIPEVLFRGVSILADVGLDRS